MKIALEIAIAIAGFLFLINISAFIIELIEHKKLIRKERNRKKESKK